MLTLTCRAAAVAMLWCLTSAPLEAQCADAPASSALITAVELHRGNVFDTSGTIRWWQRLGNTLHRVTRPHVIRRELLLDPCAPYDSARAAETERNLRSLGTFRSVQVDTVRGDTGVVLTVVTQDGWSTRPELTFSSTGRQTTFTAGISEENFLGHAAVFGVRYSSDPDRRSTSLRFSQRRMFGTYGVELGGEDRTDGWNASAAIERPFFSYESEMAAGARAVGFDGAVRRYRGGAREPDEILARRFGLIALNRARAFVAAPSGYLRAGVVVQVKSDAYAPEGGSAPRSTVGTAGAWVDLSRARFVKVEQFRSLGRTEDVDVSPRVRAGLLAAPAALGYEHGGVGLELSGRIGTAVGSGFVLVEGGANGLYTAAGLDSGQVSVDATMLLRPARDLAVLVHARRGWQERPAPGEEYDVGFGQGLRAHRAHAFTGDRVELLAGELRWAPLKDVLGLVNVGVAAVAAHGGAWWSDEKQRTGSELGGGLRFGPTRLAGGTIGRMDLMWRFETDREPGGWTLVFGEGLTF